MVVKKQTTGVPDASHIVPKIVSGIAHSKTEGNRHMTQMTK